KPFTPNELRSLVTRALESKHFCEEEVSTEAELKKGTKTEIFIPQGLYCIPANSWAKIEQDDNVRIGIHHIFLRTLKKIIFIDFPKENETRYQGEACLRITDSNMQVYRLWTPVSGRVIAVNEEIKKDYSKLMKDPYKEGWMLLVAPIHLKDDLKNLVYVDGT
ncbi:unnamed protein product, partial [marine sediment metagenome]